MSFNPCNPWTSISTPICSGRRNMNCDTPNTNSTSMTSFTNNTNLSVRSGVSSNASILRSSSLYRENENENGNEINKRRQKRVSIVSPIKWDCMQRKRDFINTTISYCNIKHILRSIGYDTNGGYKQCVERLLQSNWIPSQKYIKYNEKLRAKPIFNENERIINLECGDINYLKQFHINELKKWLKYNNIKQPRNVNKYQCIQLINQNYTFKSPSPNSLRFKLPPKTPKNKNINENNNNNINTNNNILFENNNHLTIANDDDDVRMQLCFDD